MEKSEGKFYDKNYRASKKEVRMLTRRNRIVALEHHIDKLHSQLRAVMGFCVKIEDHNPFETDIHLLQNDACYLRESLDTILDEWEDTTKSNDVDCHICGDFHDADNVPLSCLTGDGE